VPRADSHLSRRRWTLAGHHVQDVATPEAFRANPEMVWQFTPNAVSGTPPCRQSGAFCIGELERIWRTLLPVHPKRRSLHEQAGSKTHVHMHGRLMQTRCSRETCRTKPFEDDRPTCRGRRFRPARSAERCCGPTSAGLGRSRFLWIVSSNNCESVPCCSRWGLRGWSSRRPALCAWHESIAHELFISVRKSRQPPIFRRGAASKAGEVLPKLVKELCRLIHGVLSFQRLASNSLHRSVSLNDIAEPATRNSSTGSQAVVLQSYPTRFSRIDNPYVEMPI